MSMVRKGLIMIGGTTAAGFLGMVHGIIIARVLGPEGTGQFQLAITISVFVAAFFVLGVSKSNIYSLNRWKADPPLIIGNSVFFSVLSGFLAFLVVYSVFSYAEGYTGRFDFRVRLIFSLSMIFLCLQAVIGPILIAQMRVVEYNASQLSIRLLTVLLFGAFALAGWLSTGSALVITAFLHVLGVVVLLFFLRSHLSFAFVPDLKLLWKTIRYGLRLHVVDMLLTLDLGVGMIFIALLMPGEFDSMGYYSRAIAICGLIRLIPISLSTLLYSHWALIDEGKRVQQVERVLRTCLLLGILIIIVIFFGGRYLLVILYGKAFLPSYIPLVILSLQQIFWMSSKVFHSLFNASGKPTFTIYTLSVSNVFSIMGLIVLIPEFGIIGAAAAVTLAQFIHVTLNFITARRYFGLRILNCFVLRYTDITFLFDGLKRKGAV